jgi:hypothetical protein
MNTTTYTQGKLSAHEVVELIGASREVLSALVLAERCGQSSVGRVQILHNGYVNGASDFRAESALFRVTWPA